MDAAGGGCGEGKLGRPCADGRVRIAGAMIRDGLRWIVGALTAFWRASVLVPSCDKRQQAHLAIRSLRRLRIGRKRTSRFATLGQVLHSQQPQNARQPSPETWQERRAEGPNMAKQDDDLLARQRNIRLPFTVMEPGSIISNSRGKSSSTSPSSSTIRKPHPIVDHLCSDS